MASKTGVWGVDIGHCALKALRCEYDTENRMMVATAFDYVEHPKILSQPDANPKELVREALAQFLERNQVRGDRVAVSVPGQNGLARFFQPPPVDMKRLPEIVRFEARQQIPFPLEEVIWDYQMMGGASEVEGFLMEAEVGLFAMKRDQVYEALQPFLTADLEIHHIQLAPLCAYNFLAHSLLAEVLENDVYDADSPPDSYVVLNVGTDTTDLVITNGFRVWQRSIPLGGNHFTKQLTKELKLTFAKAEHLKRNVREAEDAKAVIQSMRPVFNDLLTEVQRSIGFFQNIDRRAQINGIITLGNAVKLPGLQQYLSKNLGYPLVDVEQQAWGARMAGQAVLTSPQFKENLPSFAICYGLCLQGLGLAKLTTNLLPKEIITERLIRSKKPWAVATAGALMLAFAVSFFFEYNEWYKVHPTTAFAEATWDQAMSDVASVQTLSTNFDSEDRQRVSRLEELAALGEELSGNSDRRLLWLELMQAINRALPIDEKFESPNQIPDPRVIPISQRRDLHIEYVESQYFEDLSRWFTPAVKRKYVEEILRQEGKIAATVGPVEALPVEPEVPEDEEPNGEPGTEPASKPAAKPAAEAGGAGPAGLGDVPSGEAGGGQDGSDAEEVAPIVDREAEAVVEAAMAEFDMDAITGPEGPGWVIELRGYHYFNEDPQTWGGTHVRDTLLKNLREGTIQLPTELGQAMEEFTMEELGIGFGILAVERLIDQNYRVPNPYYEPPVGAPAGRGLDMEGLGGLSGLGGFGGGQMPKPGTAKSPPKGARGAIADPEAENPRFFAAPRYQFVVQFCWQERLLAERLRAREEALLDEEDALTELDGEEITGAEENQTPLNTEPGD
jgi:type IV pilus assembly protein PilM